MGYSFGGYHAPRVAAFDKRYAACVAFGAMHWSIYDWVAGNKAKLAVDPRKSSTSIFQFRWVVGAPDNETALEWAKKFTLEGVAHDLEVVRTPLLVVKQDGALPVSLLVDRVAGFAITQPEPGRLVFGTRGELPTRDPTDPAEREATPNERDELYVKFCAASTLALPDDECRAHAGLEIQRKQPVGADGAVLHESIDERTRRKVSPIIGADPRFSNLRWALPGRATLALSVARTLVADLELTERETASPALGSRWEADIEMFYRASYD
jgi:hypothetical protein